MVKKLNLVLFGSGRIGSVHFMNMLTNEHAQITWIVEAEISRAKELVEKYSMVEKVKITSDASEALADQSVDGVMICTHHQIHSQLVIQAFKAGKPVFCEKPLSLSIEETENCYDLAEKCKLPLMCAFNRRFDPQNRLIFNRVKNGEVGKIRVVHVCCRDPKSMISKPYLEISVGVFLDAMVHEIDIASFMIGEIAETVYATGHASHSMFTECDDIDSALVVLKYPSGAVANLEMSRYTTIGHDQRLEVLGTTGVLQSGNQRPLEVLQWKENGIQQEPIYEGLDRYYDSYKMEVEHFIDVLKGKKPLEVTAKSVISTGIIAVACKESLDTQQAINIRKFAKDKFNYVIQ